jgi:hypothetical protein
MRIALKEPSGPSSSRGNFPSPKAPKQAETALEEAMPLRNEGKDKLFIPIRRLVYNRNRIF